MLYRRLIINGTEYMLAVSQSGSGAPKETTVGAVGVLYMDTDDGSLYKCTGAADGRYTWEPMGTGNGTGQDGGYYTPVVTQPTDDTMEVAFTPSKAGMPAVQPATVKLPVGSGSGSSGVHVGPEAPEDTNLLWVDTDDEAEDEIESPVQSVNGKTGVVELTAADVGAYDKTEIDAILGSYVNDIAALVGGDA